LLLLLLCSREARAWCYLFVRKVFSIQAAAKRVPLCVGYLP